MIARNGRGHDSRRACRLRRRPLPDPAHTPGRPRKHHRPQEELTGREAETTAATGFRRNISYLRFEGVILQSGDIYLRFKGLPKHDMRSIPT